MEKDYFVTWFLRGGAPTFCANIVRIEHAPHEEPKGPELEELVVDGVHQRNPEIRHDVIDICSVCELPNPVWCLGQTREVVIAGRPASLEAAHNGWRIHI